MTADAVLRRRDNDNALFAHFFGDCDPYPAPQDDWPPANARPAASGAAASGPMPPAISAVRPG